MLPELGRPQRRRARDHRIHERLRVLVDSSRMGKSTTRAARVAAGAALLRTFRTSQSAG
jgi:hypothetical protein